MSGVAILLPAVFHPAIPGNSFTLLSESKIESKSKSQCQQEQILGHRPPTKQSVLKPPEWEQQTWVLPDPAQLKPRGWGCMAVVGASTSCHRCSRQLTPCGTPSRTR